MGVGVDAGDEDVGVVDTGPDEGQADGLGEVDVEAAGHGAGDARAAVGDKADNGLVGAGRAVVISVRWQPCLRKSGGKEGFGDFRTDLIFSTVPFHPECTAATARRTGSYIRTGMQSAVLAPMATPGTSVISASKPSRSSRVRAADSTTATRSPCT